MRIEEDLKVIDHYLCIRMPHEVDHHNAGNIAEAADEMICKSEVLGRVIVNKKICKWLYKHYNACRCNHQQRAVRTVDFRVELCKSTVITIFNCRHLPCLKKYCNN